MCKTCQNLSCQQQGADLQYLKLHVQMQSKLRYHMKHTYGISTNFNCHMEDMPWYGAGQGTADAAPRWIIQADSLMKAHQSQATVSSLSTPNNKSNVPQHIDDFLDNTWMSNHGPQPQDLTNVTITTQSNLTLWHDLLKASGGLLNHQKCIWFLFHWKFHPSGKISLITPTNTPTLTVTDTSQQIQPI